MTKSNTNKNRALAIAFFTGTLSATLYFLLYLFSDMLPDLAEETRQGKKIYALVPLAIALLFSFVHGAFTSQFWSLLGLTAKK